MIFLFSKRQLNDDVGGARGTVFQKIHPGAGFKTGDFVKKQMGGATVERFDRFVHNSAFVFPPPLVV